MGEGRKEERRKGSEEGGEGEEKTGKSSRLSCAEAIGGKHSGIQFWQYLKLKKKWSRDWH